MKEILRRGARRQSQTRFRAQGRARSCTIAGPRRSTSLLFLIWLCLQCLGACISLPLPVERQKRSLQSFLFRGKILSDVYFENTELNCSRVEEEKQARATCEKRSSSRDPVSTFTDLRFQHGGPRKDCRAPAGDGSHAKEQGDRGATIRFPRLRTRLAGRRHPRKSRDWAWRSRRAV